MDLYLSTGSSNSSNSSNSGQTSSGGKRSLNDEYGLLPEEKCSAPRAKIFLVMAISFVVAAVVVLVVVLTRIEPTASSSPPSDVAWLDCWYVGTCPNATKDEEPSCPDIAIVGAGLAGSYAAWLLKDTNATVYLYEMSDRIGGRILTTSFPSPSKAKIELGATYFIPKLHKRMDSLVEQFKLTKEKVYKDCKEDCLMYRLRGVNMNIGELRNSSKIPYNMDTEEKDKLPLSILRDYLQEAVPLISRDSKSSTNSSHGQFLNDISIRGALLRYASHEAYNFIRDSSEPRLFYDDGSASEFLDYLNDAQEQEVTHDDYYTLEEGMDSLPRELVKEALLHNQRLGLRKNQRLYRIEETEGIYRLYFYLTETEGFYTSDTQGQTVTCAKNIILAISPSAISSLDWSALKDSYLQTQLDSVFNIPSTKLFLQFPSPWWGDENSEPSWRTMQTDMPLGEVQRMKDTSNANDSFILQAMYTQEDFSNYWFSLLQGKDFESGMKGEFKISERLVEHAQKHLSKLNNSGSLQDIPLPSSAIFHQWKSLPYGAAWHVWKPNVDWTKVSKDMLKPVTDKNIFVVGSAFAPGNLNLWAEGALHTVDELMNLHSIW